MTEEDKKNILHVVKDCSDSLTRIEGEREFIKEAIVGLNDKYELDKKPLRKVISIYYKQNKSEVEAEQGEVIELYESLTK